MATKKITELPFINTLSGSSVFDNPAQNTVVPVVLYGTTNQITIENFSKFTTLYAAQTGSQNIFTQNQWFNTIVSASTINVGTLGVGGNTTIAGTLGVTGNGTIGGNLAVAGRITAEEFHTEITTASVIYASGSTKFGDDTGDKHEFTGSINVSGSVIYNGVILSNIDANTIQRLQQATASIQQATASIQQATASLNTFTASQDNRNFTLSQVTGSFAGEIGGLEAYTASLKTAAIVSSSTQIQNYNLFAVTSSGNTFYGNQSITGSLSVSAGEFNVTTGSGNATSSLIFDHTQNDGVTLGLRHNDRLSLADHTFNVNVWAAGVYTTFVRNGTPYSILNVEAFDDNKIYLYRDARLFNKSLVIDNNLTVQKGVVIGSGSLSIERGQFNAITGSGALTSSLSFTHTTVDPITGDGTLALRYRNNQVGSENNAWKFVATDNGVQVRYDQYTTSNKMLFSVSSFGSNFDKLLIWRDVRLFGTGLTVDDSLLVKGVITGSILATNGVVSSSNQLFELNQFTASQDGRNFTLSQVTGSLIGITNGLMAFTAALDNTYATDAQLYQLYQSTRSLELHSGSMIGVTNGLMAYTASNTSLNTGLRGEVDGIEAYTASLKGQAIVSSSTQVQNYDVFALNSNLYTSTGSLIGITNGLMVFTASLKSAILPDGTDLSVIGNLKVTGSTTTDAVQFDKTAGINVTEGQMAWNNSDGTLDIGLKGGNVVLQVGQETLYEVRNDTGVSIPVGTSLFANGVTAGSGRITAAPFVADGSVREVRYLGLATETIGTGVNGFVTHFGYVRGLDTRGTTLSAIAVGDESWAVGDILYAHPTVGGKLTNILPKHEIIVAIIVVRHQSSGVLFVRPSSFGHLEDNHDVNINTASLSNGDLLVYDGVDGNWRNSKSLTGSLMATNGVISSSAQLPQIDGLQAYTASLKGQAIVSSSQQITNYNLFAQTSSANTFYGEQSITGSLRVTGSLKVGDWFHGEGAVNTAKLDIRTSVDRGLKIDGGVSSDVIITAYQGAVGGNIRTMRLEGSDINIFTGNGNANTGSYIGGFNTNGLAFAAGKGIDFSATSNGSGTTTSELLNDYEEGTWTPTFAGTGGNSGQVYVTQDGAYTKVGRLVTFTANLALSTLGTITGFVRIDGLPFTPQLTPVSRAATTIAYATTITTIPASDVYGSNTFMYLYKQSQTNPTTTTQLSQGDLTATTVWNVSGFYYTA